MSADTNALTQRAPSMKGMSPVESPSTHAASRSDAPLMAPSSSSHGAGHSTTVHLLKLLGCAGGILVCYFVFGGYQEAM